LIPAGPRCSYLAATFDRGGVAAIEGCAGWAYVVQLDRRNRVIRRLRLAPGYDGGGIATDWRTGTVLISETQTSHPPLFDWVWSLHGGRLRVVHRYPGRDAISVIAEPW
jgi:hypothetical protein